MRSSSIRTIRRAELSRAAFEAVIRYGLRKTTLDKVGDIAGVSKGVVLHHFKDKSALLEAVFRRSNSLLSDPSSSCIAMPKPRMSDFGPLSSPISLKRFSMGKCVRLGCR